LLASWVADWKQITRVIELDSLNSGSEGDGSTWKRVPLFWLVGEAGV